MVCIHDDNSLKKKKKKGSTISNHIVPDFPYPHTLRSYYNLPIHKGSAVRGKAKRNDRSVAESTIGVTTPLTNWFLVVEHPVSAMPRGHREETKLEAGTMGRSGYTKEWKRRENTKWERGRKKDSLTFSVASTKSADSTRVQWLSNSLSRDWIFNNAAKIMERYRGNNRVGCSLEEVSRSMIKCSAASGVVGWQPCTRTRVSRGSFVASNSFGACFHHALSFLSPRPLASWVFYTDERSLDYPGIILIRPWRRRKVSFEDVLVGV